jgi:RimJ/RimL family protein N-acetyltransferase
VSGAEIRALRPGEEPIVDAFVRAHADSSLFLRRNLAERGLHDGDVPYCGTWAGAFEDGRLVAVAQHSRFGAVLLQAPVHTGAVAREAARASGRRVGGFTGPWAQVLAAREALGLTGAPTRMESRQRLYALSLDALIVPEELRAGRWRCRLAHADDLDQLAAWRAGFNVESNGHTDGPAVRETSRAEVERGLAERACWVLDVDDTPVAMQQFNAMLPDVVQVGGVWTPPASRGRGYGRAVVAGALLAARAEGVRRSVLFTDDDNLPAQRAYRALGYEQVGDYGLIFLETPAPGPGP